MCISKNDREENEAMGGWEALCGERKEEEELGDGRLGGRDGGMGEKGVDRRRGAAIIGP